jgi:hypothetical protein
MHSDADSRPDDGNPDGPDNWPPPVPAEPGSCRRGPRIAALTLTALVALGSGAGAVYVYQSGLAGATPAAFAVQGGTAGPVSGGATAWSFGQVHVGDTVAVQITGFDRVATVVSLQDPATAWGR